MIFEKHFPAVFQSLSEGLIAINNRGLIELVNPAAEEILMLKEKDLIGKPVTDVIPDSPLPNLLAGEKVPETQVLERKGNYLAVRHFSINENGMIAGAYSLYQDVTVQKKLQQKMQNALEKQRELEAVLEHSHDGMSIIDGEGIFVGASKSLEKFCGVDRNTLVGTSVYDLVDSGLLTDAASARALSKKRPVTVITENTNGRRALATAIPVFNNDGTIWRVVSNIRDITDLTRVEQKLEETREQARHYRGELDLLRDRELRSHGIITQSGAMKDVMDVIIQAAKTEATVLILGESGVGKDVVARFIHNHSSREKGPLIKINCGAIPENLLESELFGYEEGAFTGARKSGKPGMFELASGGTIFLDEIGEMPLSIQAKLLQVIQDRRIIRVGGTESITLDVRILAATNRDLGQMVADKKFRQDLFYRLNVIPVVIPPLRDRRQDIIPLVFHALDKFNQQYSLAKRIAPLALEMLYHYDWPGNVRELENIMERLVVTSPSENITPENLPTFISEGFNGTETAEREVTPLKKAKDELERRLIELALSKYGNTYRAAAALGVAQPTVVRKAQKYGIKTS